MDFIKNIFGFGSDKSSSSSSYSKTEEQRNEQRVDTAQPRRAYARVQPLLQDCPQAGNTHKDQGLEWCSKSLKRDEDDDYAHGFLDENACFVENQRLKKSVTSSTTAQE